MSWTVKLRQSPAFGHSAGPCRPVTSVLLTNQTCLILLSPELLEFYGFSWGHVWMWELDCEEGWVPKNCSFWSVELEKTLESPLDCKEIQPVHSEGDQPWDFFGGNDAEAETPVLWPPHEKSWLIRKNSDAARDWGQEEKGTTENEIGGWHHGLDGRESGWTPRDADGQGGLACCDSWGHRVGHDWVTELNWTEETPTWVSHSCIPDPQKIWDSKCLLF